MHYILLAIALVVAWELRKFLTILVLFGVMVCVVLAEITAVGLLLYAVVAFNSYAAAAALVALVIFVTRPLIYKRRAALNALTPYEAPLPLRMDRHPDEYGRG